MAATQTTTAGLFQRGVLNAHLVGSVKQGMTIGLPTGWSFRSIGG